MSKAPINTQQVIQQILKDIQVPGKRYHAELPKSIRGWYIYTIDGGHSILCILKRDSKILEGEASLKERINYLAPVPVKTVLRGYEIIENYVVVDCDYSSDIGLIFDSNDEEF